MTRENDVLDDMQAQFGKAHGQHLPPAGRDTLDDMQVQFGKSYGRHLPERSARKPDKKKGLIARWLK